jgi:polysaccharide export outer membrane protein
MFCFKRLAATACVSCLLSASLFGRTSAAQKPYSADAAATTTTIPPQPGSYRFTPGDTVLIRFFFNPELNDEAQIRPDGHLSMLLIGDINFASRTVEDVTGELEQRYRSEVKTPRVTVQVRSYAAQKVFVSGEVLRPGVVSLIGGQDLTSAVAEAGGVKQTGKARSWILVRRGAGGQLLTRNISFQKGNPSYERLQPFDLIIVPPRAITRVDRFVDEYIRQVLPGNLEAGFQYLYNRTGSVVSVLPF